jgi:hypothetical protein
LERKLKKKTKTARWFRKDQTPPILFGDRELVRSPEVTVDIKAAIKVAEAALLIHQYKQGRLPSVHYDPRLEDYQRELNLAVDQYEKVRKVEDENGKS